MTQLSSTYYPICSFGQTTVRVSRVMPKPAPILGLILVMSMDIMADIHTCA